MNIQQLALDNITCKRCGAEPGYWCMTTRGRYVGSVASNLHADRMRLLYDIYFEGVRDGIEDEKYRQQIRERRAS